MTNPKNTSYAENEAERKSYSPSQTYALLQERIAKIIAGSKRTIAESERVGREFRDISTKLKGLQGMS